MATLLVEHSRGVGKTIAGLAIILAGGVVAYLAFKPEVAAGWHAVSAKLIDDATAPLKGSVTGFMADIFGPAQSNAPEGMNNACQQAYAQCKTICTPNGTLDQLCYQNCISNAHQTGGPCANT